MRTVHWLFVVSVALFLSGIGFVIASARPGAEGPVVEAPVTIPVASVKQVMKGIMAPAALTVFNSVGTVMTTEGIEERAPKTDEDWETVGNAAAALAESANLLLMDNRIIDKGNWITMSHALIEASRVTLKAVEAKNTDALLAAGGGLAKACDDCHMRYQR
jgi:hypothetical protein